MYTDYYNHYIQIHTPNRMIKTYMSFAEFSPLLLKYKQFISPYRNCMINMDYVQQMDDHDFLMKDQVQIPINRAAQRMKFVRPTLIIRLSSLNEGKHHDAPLVIF